MTRSILPVVFVRFHARIKPEIYCILVQKIMLSILSSTVCLDTSSVTIVKSLELALGPEIEEFVNIFADDLLVNSMSFEETYQTFE